MTFAAPLALALLVLAVPVALAFLARRRAPKAVVGSVILLRVAVASAQAHQLAPKLRGPLALALTLLALAALAGAVAGPSCGGGAGGRLIVIVDPASPLAYETVSGATALEDGVDALAAMIDALPAGAEVIVLQAGNPPTPLVGRTHDRRAAARALRDLSPQGPPADLTAARELADTLCRDPERDRVVWLVPGAPPAGGRCADRGVAVAPAGVNVGIAELVARRADGLGLLELLIGISGDVPREVDLAIRVDGKLVETARLDVLPGTVTWDVRRLELDGERVRVELLDVDDANAADDRAEVVIERVAPLAIGLATDRPASFVATALRLHPGAVVQVVEPAQLPMLADLDLAVIEVPARAPAGVPVIAFGPEAARAVGLPLRETVEQPEILRWAFEDPRLAFVELDGVQLARAAPLPVPPGGMSLIDADIGPILVAGPVDGREVVAFGFAARDTDLVLRTSFLHLISNLIEAAGRGEVAGARAPTPGASGIGRPTVGQGETIASVSVARPGGVSWVGWLLGVALLALLAETGLSAAAGWFAARRAP